MKTCIQKLLLWGLLFCLSLLPATAWASNIEEAVVVKVYEGLLGVESNYNTVSVELDSYTRISYNNGTLFFFCPETTYLIQNIDSSEATMLTLMLGTFEGMDKLCSRFSSGVKMFITFNDDVYPLDQDTYALTRLLFEQQATGIDIDAYSKAFLDQIDLIIAALDAL